jgi:hypothetical protein
MEPVVGIFVSRSAAELAARNLRAKGWPRQRIRMLSPERSAAVEDVPLAAREEWRVGLRDAENAHYEVSRGNRSVEAAIPQPRESGKSAGR